MLRLFGGQEVLCLVDQAMSAFRVWHPGSGRSAIAPETVVDHGLFETLERGRLWQRRQYVSASSRGFRS